MERKIVFTNEEIKGLLEEKLKIVEDAKKVIKQVEELDKELQTKQLLIGKIHDRIKPLVDAKMKDEVLEEFDVVHEVRLADDGQIEIEILNELTEYGKALREKRRQDSIKK